MNDHKRHTRKQSSSAKYSAASSAKYSAATPTKYKIVGSSNKSIDAKMVMEPVTIDDVERHLGLTFTAAQKKYFNNRMANKYVYPHSNKQITTLLNEFNRPEVYFRLCELITRFARQWNFAGFTYHLLKNKTDSDIQIFEAIFSKNKHKVSSSSGTSKQYVADYIANILHNLKIAPKSLLDIGCGTCILTNDLGKTLGIEPANVYGADIPEEFETKWAELRPSTINFVVINNNKLEFNRQFDLITCMMVLHHVPLDVIGQYIIDIYQLLNKGGVFVIKEHDCLNAIDNIIADLEHSLFICREFYTTHNNTTPLTPEIKQKIFKQEIFYKDRFTWRVIIERVGFTCIYENAYNQTLENNYMANRGYIGVFKK